MEELNNINLSIQLIKKRILRIEEVQEDIIINKIQNKKYFFESLRLNLIEIGEECKNINDLLYELEGSWNDIISKQYNFRISLTHYYLETYDLLIEKHLKKDFPLFIMEIKNLEKKYGGKK